YLDRELHHRRDALRALKAIGVPPGVMSAQYEQEVKGFAKEVAELENNVRKLKDEYEVAGQRRATVEKIGIVREKVLVDTALSTVEQLLLSESPGPAQQLLIWQMSELLVNLGEIDKASDLMMPGSEATRETFVSPDHLELYLHLWAARGDYEEAIRQLSGAL